MKLIATIMFLLFLPGMDFSQQNTHDTTSLAMDSIDLTMDSIIAVDSVNIREMVEEQITAAKKKMLEEKESAITGILTSNEKTVPKETGNEVHLGVIEKIREFLYKANKDMARVALLAGSTFLVFGTVLIRRVKIKKKNIRRKKLVKNINSIREEKVVAKDNPKLKNVRTKLKNNPENFGEENSFGETAKELNISKGELLLAAKIKSYELSKIAS
jgi:hypothetical protein